MLDTVNLWLPQSHTSAIVCNNLERVKEHTDTRTAEVSFSGYMDNYQVSIFNHGISLKGSLAKYHLHDNFQTLSRKASQEAIENLSDKLSLNVSEAEVKRVDIAQNFIMQHEHKAYYDLLGTCQHFKRLEQPKSVYYNTSNKQLIFYNKIAEGRHKGLTPPCYLE